VVVRTYALWGVGSRSEEFGAWLLRLRECGGRGGPWIS
jgi:hypothetical protein